MGQRVDVVSSFFFSCFLFFYAKKKRKKEKGRKTENMAANLPKIPINVIIGALGATGIAGGVGYLGWNSFYSGSYGFPM